MIDVRQDQLKAAVLAYKTADRELKALIRDATRDTAGPIWKAQVERGARTDLDRQVLAKGARLKLGNPPQMIAASSTRKLSGGLVPAAQWAGVEFGARGDRITEYRTRNRWGGSHTVRRHTTRQLPKRDPSGRVVFAAVAEVGPRLVSAWLVAIVGAYRRASEGSS